MQKDLPSSPDWHDSNYKDIVRDQMTFQENLPLGCITYPHNYGVWIYFQRTPQTPPYFCECQRSAMINFLRLNEVSRTYRLCRDSSILNHFIPQHLAELLPAITSKEDLSGASCFRPNLCHKCLKKVPSIRWSNHGEHSVFVQHFGWYWKQRLYTYGINRYGESLQDQVPDHIAQVLKAEKHFELFAELRQLTKNRYVKDSSGYQINRDDIESSRTLRKQYEKAINLVEHAVEADLREELGFPKRGKTGNNEILLSLIIESIYSTQRVIRQARPNFLGRLTLDLFIPSLQLAIEYQGLQHYKAFKNLGGESSFQKLQERDAKKLSLCTKEGLKLVYFNRSDKLTEEYVREKIQTALTKT